MNDTGLYIDIHTHNTQTDTHVSILNIEIREGSKDLFHFNQPNEPQNLYFSAGIHPWFMEEWPNMLSTLEAIITKPRFIAIGECGLDKKVATPLNEQIELFQRHIELSEKHKKPLIIHCVKAFNELLEIRKSSQSTTPWIIHGFTENHKIAQQCINAGMWPSFGKSLFDSKSKSSSVIASLPTNNFFLETDESDISIEDIYRKGAETKGIPTEHLITDIFGNFQHCFNTYVKF